MKIVTVPLSLKKVPLGYVKDGAIIAGELDITFVGWLVLCLDSYDAMGQGSKNARKADKLANKLDSMVQAKELRLEDGDVELLLPAAEAMTWKTAANRRLVSFYDALEGAKDEEESKKKKE